MADWRPNATYTTLSMRAELLAQIRQFFAQRAIMEVDTPALSSAGNTDPHINSFKLCASPANQDQPRYFHTSPEFHMKRLLAAGMGSIYQICKVFRDGEQGRLHNPEFTLLEWYHLGFNHHALMDEMDALLMMLLGCPAAQRLTYREIFLTHCGIDPHCAAISELQAQTKNLGMITHLTRDDYLDLLITHGIADHLGKNGRPTFVYDYPASQASLARISPAAPEIAARFEVYLNGIELANGFYELTDSNEQRQRFLNDCAQRNKLNLPLIPIDEHLLAALEHGLPECSGVALGIERLLMIKLGINHIKEVIAFPFERA